jgi:putative ABC transport system permease protein
MLVDAIRSLARSRGVTLFVLLVLTLAIAATTVTFSVVDAVVLRPLPFADPGALVAIEHQRGDRVMSQARSLAAVQYLALRDGAEGFGSLAAVSRGAQTIEGDGEPERVWSARVTASLFEVLGVRPVIGTTFTADNEVSGQDRVAVIGHGLWSRRFARDPNVVGRSIRVAGGSLQILGVMPEGFAYPLSDDRLAEIWTPYVVPDDERSGVELSSYLHVIGRLRPGASVAHAQAQTDVVRQRLASGDADRYPAAGRFAVIPLHEWVVGTVSGWMVLVLVAVALVLLIACANVANLLLTRALDRTRELSIRSALGASRGRLVASVLMESALLSLVAAAAAIVVAWWGVEAARNGLPPGIARAHLIALNARVLAAAIASAVLSSLLVGVIPAVQAGRHDLVSVLKNGAPGTTSLRSRWRHLVLVSEIAFTAILLVATVLFVSSFVRLSRADLGFDRSRLLVLTSVSGLDGTIVDFADRMKAIPGVVSVGGAAAGSPPLIAAGFEGGSSATRLRRPDAPEGEFVLSEFNRVTPDYFTAAAIPFLRGRTFAQTELSKSMRAADLTSTNTVVLDELAARQLFGDRDPIGLEVTYGKSRASVIGVVANVRMRGPEADSGPQAYFPGPVTAGSYAYLVRTSGRSADVVPAVQAALAALRPANSRPAQVRIVEDAFRNITARRRFSAAVMTVLGILAVLIGASGVYAVMASLVAQRTREIGVRMALGASPQRILRTVVGQIGRYLAIGLAVGLPAAWIVSRGFGGLFFEVRPTDLWIYALVTVMLAAIGVAAALIPARRAALIDPLLALRTD